MNKLAVVVSTPPHSHLTASALDYIETALTMSINIIGVFFYQDGVVNGNKYVDIASDEFQAIAHWERLHRDYKLPLHLCITAAQKRGINCEDVLDNTASEHNLNKIFTVSGLGELVELATQADRTVQF